jgi:hypothetical protein
MIDVYQCIVVLCYKSALCDCGKQQGVFNLRQLRTRAEGPACNAQDIAKTIDNYITINSHMRARTGIYSQAYTRTHTHIIAQTCQRAMTHNHTHIRTHTHIHTHIWREHWHI